MQGIFDIGIDSDIAFPELGEVECPPAVITIRGDTALPSFQFEQDEGHVFPDLTFRQDNDHYHLELEGLAEFVISPSENHIRYRVASDTSMATLRHLLIDIVIPGFLGQQGKLVMHASMVRLENGKTVLLVGESGAGKSTLAAAFLPHGAEVLCDDSVLLEVSETGVIAIASYSGLRVYDDSADMLVEHLKESGFVSDYNDKRRYLPGKQSECQSESKARVDGLFILNVSEKNSGVACRVRQLQGADTLMSLLPHFFLLDDAASIGKQGHIARVADFVSSELPVFQLQLRHDFDAIPEVYETVCDLVSPEEKPKIVNL